MISTTHDRKPSILTGMRYSPRLEQTCSRLLAVLLVVWLLLAGTGMTLAQGTLTDSLILRNATNGRLTFAPNTATTPAGSWRLTWPQSAGSTGSILYGTLTGSDVALSWLAPGINGQVLTLSGGVPTWASAPNWLTTGNAGLNTGSLGSPGPNYLGTNDAQDLPFVVNSIERMRIRNGSFIDWRNIVTAAGGHTGTVLTLDYRTATGGPYTQSGTTRGHWVSPVLGGAGLGTASSGTIVSFFSQYDIQAAGDNTGSLIGFQSRYNVNASSGGVSGEAIAFNATLQMPGGTIANHYGFRENDITAAGTITNKWGFRATPPGSATNYVGVQIDNIGLSGSQRRRPFFYNATNLNEQFLVNGAGFMALGDSSLSAKFVIADNAARTAAFTGQLINNFATSSTAAINKIGLDIASTGSWTGLAATNIGLRVLVSGGTTNYAATFTGGNVGVGTTAPAAAFHVDGTAGTPNVRLTSVSGAAAGTVPLGYDRVLIANNTGDVNQASYNAVVGTTAWLLAGNSITASWDGITGSFLGTTNTQDLVLNTNNVFRARLVGGAVNTGNLVLGTTAASPTNSTAASATDRLTVLGGDISLNSETNSAITRQILFRGTSGAGNFRVGADGGDIFWQGGGGQQLQMGSFWGIQLLGQRGVVGFPAFAAGAAANPHVNVILQQNAVTGLAITPTLTFTANQQEWRNNAGTALSVVNASGNFGLGVITGITAKLQVNANTTSGNAIQLDPHGVAAGNTSQIRFLELAANGTNYAAFRSADNMAANNIYTLPASVGTAGQTLTIASVTGTDATLTWSTAGSSIHEEVTAGTGDIRRRVAYTNGTVGNPGDYANDFMGVRTAATMTASGNYSGILTGTSNTASGQYSLVVGGASNQATNSYSSVLGGSFNIVGGQYSFVGSGTSNNVSGNYSAVPGGASNNVSSNYSLTAGQLNSVSGNNTFVFGYGASVSQSNSVVFNFPTAGTDATRVGINTNSPNTNLDVDGGVAIRPPANVQINANGATLTPGHRSYIVLDPNGGDRTGLILANGVQTGQILILRILETSGNFIQLPDAGANNASLTGNWVGRADDTITLIWSGVDWVELSRSNN